MRRLTKEEFVCRAQALYGDKYDYSRTKYVNSNTKVCVLCREHGEFWVTPSNHLRGRKCPICARINSAKIRSFDTDTFVKKAREVHGNRYDYSKTEYIDTRTKVCIICPKHGAFWQAPNGHLNGKGCAKCAGKESDRELFIQKSQEVHGEKYDYSKVDYKGARVKVCVICPIHGKFFVTPSNHQKGRGCPKCSGHHKRTKEEFVDEATKIHNGKYNYSKCNFKKTSEKVCIICPIHGEFEQLAASHLQGKGCPKCKYELIGDNLRMTTPMFIEKAKAIYGDKYDYSKAEYTLCQNKVCIICPEHGEFWKTPNSHLSGQGCPKCAIEGAHKDAMLKKEEVIKRFREIHGDKYNYSLVDYNGVDRLVDIICPKHGVFKQTPYRHMIGNGCPKCSNSQGENAIIRVLDKYNVKYEYQYKILLNLTLWGKKELRVDFYLPQENMMIEYNGIQHYEEVKHFHEKDNGFEKQRARDRKLKKWCEDNNIKLLVIKYTQKERIEEILKQHINLDKYEKNYTQKTKNE